MELSLSLYVFLSSSSHYSSYVSDDISPSSIQPQTCQLMAATTVWVDVDTRPFTYTWNQWKGQCTASGSVFPWATYVTNSDVVQFGRHTSSEASGWWAGVRRHCILHAISAVYLKTPMRILYRFVRGIWSGEMCADDDDFSSSLLYGFMILAHFICFWCFLCVYIYA